MWLWAREFILHVERFFPENTNYCGCQMSWSWSDCYKVKVNTVIFIISSFQLRIVQRLYCGGVQLWSIRQVSILSTLNIDRLSPLVPTACTFEWKVVLEEKIFLSCSIASDFLSWTVNFLHIIFWTCNLSYVCRQTSVFLCWKLRHVHICSEFM